jgi:hypothetical protein
MDYVVGGFGQMAPVGGGPRARSRRCISYARVRLLAPSPAKLRVPLHEFGLIPRAASCGCSAVSTTIRTRRRGLPVSIDVIALDPARGRWGGLRRDRHRVPRAATGVRSAMIGSRPVIWRGGHAPGSSPGTVGECRQCSISSRPRAGRRRFPSAACTRASRPRSLGDSFGQARPCSAAPRPSEGKKLPRPTTRFEVFDPASGTLDGRPLVAPPPPLPPPPPPPPPPPSQAAWLDPATSILATLRRTGCSPTSGGSELASRSRIGLASIRARRHGTLASARGGVARSGDRHARPGSVERSSM